MSNTFVELRHAFEGLLTPSGRFLKRMHQPFIEAVTTCNELVEFDTIDQKLWALRTNVSTRPRCYCGGLTKFHPRSSFFRVYCSVRCSIADPATNPQRTKRRLDSGAAVKTKSTVDAIYGKQEIQRRRTDGIQKKYGVDSYFASPEFQQRLVDSNMALHGVKYISQLQTTKDKVKQTCNVRYGTDHYMQSTNYRARKAGIEVCKRAKMLQKYGVEFSSQAKIADKVDLLDCKAHMTTMYVTDRLTAAEIAHYVGVSATTVLSYLRKHGINIRTSCIGYSRKSIGWLNYVSDQFKVDIKHALNGGEYCIPGTRYRADGYCADTNTIYEFHGDCFHGNPVIYDADSTPNPFSTLTASQLYARTKQRDNLIVELGYNLITMWEHDWDQIEHNPPILDLI